MLSFIPLFPLVGFLLNGVWYVLFQSPPQRRKAGSLIPGLLASVSVGASFLVSLFLFFKLKSLPVDERVIEEVVYSWLSIPGIEVNVALRFDPLSSVFCLFVSGVATLIHVYSIGYMKNDATPGKFFAFLNLFTFAMLVLVLASSLPLLFLGWEGVGLCSYLLIGYWYVDMAKASAGKKAFIVNRIGDLGFLLGMFLVFQVFGSLDLAEIKNAGTVNPTTLTAIGLLLFLGAAGKSAQIPLYVWLPDAMAGPTPVSALIHAATMVTSGVYLVARLNGIYSLAPQALEVMAVVGVGTAFFAATMAIVETDIKKILAYSTISQLGYMFLGCGVAAYGAGVSHVITHSFFKALLFLGAGSVIHGMHEEQNILRMGGLNHKMKWTFVTFAAGAIALCGIPPFSGFFTKDEILWRAYSSPLGSAWLWGLGSLTAIMTSFYMTRLFVLTFLGRSRFDEGKRVHESSSSMVLPLQILAFLSVVGGLIAFPHFNLLEGWLEKTIPASSALAEGVSPSMEWALMAFSVLGSVLGIFVAYRLYSNIAFAEQLKAKVYPIHKVLRRKWYVDEIYEFLFVKPVHGLSVAAWRGFDVGVIDRIVLGVGRISERTGQVLRILQTGAVQVYAFCLLLGLLVGLGYLIYGMV